MGEVTEFVHTEVAQLLRDFDNQLDTFFVGEDRAGLLAFLEKYMTEFPSLGACIRSCFPENSPVFQKELNSYLKERYRECRMRKSDVSAYELLADGLLASGGMTEEQAVRFRRDTTRLLTAFHESEWRMELDQKKGYQFLSRSDLSASIRNVIFHLAFALGLPAETVSALLKKGLLQQDFNPKDHREVIYWWCLKHQIPYAQMIREYFTYYHSQRFEEDYRNQKIITESLNDTEYLIDTLKVIADITNYGSDENMRNRAFWDYMRKLKVVENILLREGERLAQKEKEKQANKAEENKSQKGKEKDSFAFADVLKKMFLGRKTPREVFWKNIECFPLESRRGEDAKNQPVETFDGLRGDKGKPISEKSKNPDRHYLSADIRFRLEILEKLRKNCYSCNREPLLPVPILKELFEGISYSEDIVLNRRSGKAPIPRNMMIATMFIGFFSDDAYVRQVLPKETTVLEYFEELISYELESCGLHPLYLRNPFELFVTLCFLARDPLAYFLSSWEHSLT